MREFLKQFFAVIREGNRSPRAMQDAFVTLTDQSLARQPLADQHRMIGELVDRYNARLSSSPNAPA